LLFLHRPGSPLSEFVENFWLYEGYASPFRHERIPPDGTFKIVFNLQEDALRIYDPWDPVRHERFSGAVISRPSGRPFATDSAEEASILGVNFKLGGAFAFVGFPAAEQGDLHVDLADVWGSRVRELQQRLADARHPADRFALLEAALTVRLDRGERHHAAVRTALDHLGLLHVCSRTREVARAIGLSERRLTQLFQSEVGIGPKLFSRVRRFQHAVAQHRRDAARDWARVAAECGYFDQSHMIRDFVAFCGFTPAELAGRHAELLRRGVRPKPNHIPLFD
jgi:AraC-like DNA-binding protein